MYEFAIRSHHDKVACAIPIVPTKVSIQVLSPLMTVTRARGTTDASPIGRLCDFEPTLEVFDLFPVIQKNRSGLIDVAHHLVLGANFFAVAQT
jgi:hypothetical protein